MLNIKISLSPYFLALMIALLWAFVSDLKFHPLLLSNCCIAQHFYHFHQGLKNQIQLSKQKVVLLPDLSHFLFSIFCLRAASSGGSLSNSFLEFSFLIFNAAKGFLHWLGGFAWRHFKIYIGKGQCFVSWVSSMRVFHFFMRVVTVDLKFGCFLACFDLFPKIFLISNKRYRSFRKWISCFPRPDGLIILEGRKYLEHLSGLSDFEAIFAILSFY